MVARILIIDDQADLGRALARMLRVYEITTETDPHSALRRVAGGERYDLVLCDLKMPEMDGREVYEAFKTLEPPPMMLMMSACSDAASLVAVGCPVLLKPFKARELQDIVSLMLREGLGTGDADLARVTLE